MTGLRLIDIRVYPIKSTAAVRQNEATVQMRDLALDRRWSASRLPANGSADFRPNLVVGGCGPFAEDEWQRLRIGEVEFDAVKGCTRCLFTTVDPETGLKRPDLEPLRTLGTYRRRAAGGVCFAFGGSKQEGHRHQIRSSGTS